MAKAAATASIEDVRKQILPLWREILGGVVAGTLTSAQAAELLGSEKLKAEGSLPSGVNIQEASIAAWIDAMWLLHYVHSPSASTEYSHVTKHLEDVAGKGIVDRVLLLERLPREFVTAASIVPLTSDQFLKKTIQINTNAYLRTDKYNLLREESEGFSKLLVEFSSIVDDESKSSEAEENLFIEHVQALIGAFDLDPNRVLDLSLDTFEVKPNRVRLMGKLLNMFPSASIVPVLGYKFEHYSTADEVAPATLYGVAARLVALNVIDLDSLSSYLKPDNDVAKLNYSKFHRDSIQEAKEYLVVSLNATKTPAEQRREKLEIARSRREKEQAWKAKDQVLNLAVALAEVSTFPPFASAGMWNSVLALLLDIEAKGRSNLNEYKKLTSILAKRVSTLIEPLYRPLSASPFMQSESAVDPIQSYDELLPKLSQWLRLLGPHLSDDVVLYSKVCRVLAELVKRNPKNDNVLSNIETLVGSCVLPALSLIPSNPFASFEAWAIMQSLPFQRRWTAYGLWMSVGEETGVVAAARALAKNEAKHHFQRLTQDNVRQTGRVVARLTHSVPDVIAQFIVAQLSAYSNLIAPVVETLRYLTPLSLDVLFHSFIVNLASQEATKPDQAKQPDGVTPSPWLTNCAVSIAQLSRRYGASSSTKLDLSPVLHYLFRVLRADKINHLVVLEELLSQLGDEIHDEEAYERQVLSLNAGGPLLIADTKKEQNQAASSDRAIEALSSSLVENGLSADIAIALAQCRSRIFYNPELRNTRIISSLFDELQLSLVRYNNFISKSRAQINRSTLPTLNDLVLKFKLDIDSAFMIQRAFNLGNPSDPVSGALSLVPLIKEAELIPSDSPINPQLFGLFWSLQLHDIMVPVEDYEKSIAAAAEADKDKYRAELKAREAETAKVLSAFEATKDQWFKSGFRRLDTSMAIIERLVLPRVRDSPSDALYCAHFVRLLRKYDGGKHFVMVGYLDRVIKDVGTLLRGCTENEASRLGRFIRAALADVRRWVKDKVAFEAELATEDNKMTHETLRRLSATWEVSIQNIVVALLNSAVTSKSKDIGMNVKGALLVLKHLAGVFPTYSPVAAAVEQAVKAFVENEREKPEGERRTDLKTLADAYLTSMHHERKEGHLIPDEQYYSDLGTQPKAAHTRDDRKKKVPLVCIQGTEPVKVTKDDKKDSDAAKKLSLNPEAPAYVPVSRSAAAPSPARASSSSVPVQDAAKGDAVDPYKTEKPVAKPAASTSGTKRKRPEEEAPKKEAEAAPEVKRRRTEPETKETKEPPKEKEASHPKEREVTASTRDKESKEEPKESPMAQMLKAKLEAQRRENERDNIAKKHEEAPHHVRDSVLSKEKEKEREVVAPKDSRDAKDTRDVEREKRDRDREIERERERELREARDRLKDREHPPKEDEPVAKRPRLDRNLDHQPPAAALSTSQSQLRREPSITRVVQAPIENPRDRVQELRERERLERERAERPPPGSGGRAPRR